MSPETTNQAFLSVLENHKGIIYKIANSYARDVDSRKDLVQEIITQLWLSFSKYDDTYRHSTWVYKIALNVSISFYRKENRRVEINQPIPPEILHLHEEKNPGTIQDKTEQLYQYIRELKEMDRAVIILYLEERNQDEIAAILGLTTTNISTKVSRIKQQLKQKFINNRQIK